MSELADFLLARIAEDEAHYMRDPSEYGPGHAFRLAECEAKRRIVEMATFSADCTQHHASRESACDECRACELVEGYDLTVMEILALPYADHPGYREEWRP